VSPLQQEGFLNTESLATHHVSGCVAVGRDSVEWDLEIPEDLRYDGIVILKPGLLGISGAYQEPQAALAQEGMATLRYPPARDGDESWLESLEDPQGLHVQTSLAIIADLQERQFEIAKRVPNGNRLDFGKFSLLLQSMAGFAGPRVALAMPSGIHGIYGFATTGFRHPTPRELIEDVGHPRGFLHLARDVGSAFWSGGIALSRQNAGDVFHYAKRLRFLFETISCMRDDVIEEVGTLQDKGVPYIREVYGRDRLVRADPATADQVTKQLVIEDAGHLALQAKRNEVAARVASAVLSFD
jgi:hypothetical protein